MARPSLKKRFGQHHLLRGDLCRPLLEYLQPAGRTVVEIGPGGGVLTAELLKADARVIALEVDLDWAAHLRSSLDSARLALAVADARDFAWQRLPAASLVTGNLPFNVGTHLIEKVLAHSETVERAAFMVQKEVADRLVAEPGDSAYGALSVLAKAQAKLSYLGTVSAGSFRPPPKVDAAYVGFELKGAALSSTEMEDFRHLVYMAFTMRRKTLRNNFGRGLGKERGRVLLELAGIDGGRRAESLGVDEFMQLFEAVGRLPT